MEYETLVYKLGALHSLLRDLEAAGLYQGEHTIAYTGQDGTKQTVHVFIDGTELQIFNTPGLPAGFDFSLGTQSGLD